VESDSKSQLSNGNTSRSDKVLLKTRSDPIQEVRERKLEDEKLEEIMLPEEQESGQRSIIQENSSSLSDNIQAACM